jgi:hypothetical protein
MNASVPKSPVAAGSGVVCFVLVVGGVSGLLHEWLGWIRFMGFVRLLVPDGYEIASYIVMIVLGFAIGVAGDRVGRPKSR